MLRLTIEKSRRWVTLASCGVEIEIDPVTALVMATARNGADMLSLTDDANIDMRLVALSSEVAKLVIRDWRGVGDADDQPIPVSPEAIGALMDLTVVNREFKTLVVDPHLLMIMEKKGSAPLRNGTSQKMAPNTAPPAPDAAPSVLPN